MQGRIKSIRVNRKGRIRECTIHMLDGTQVRALGSAMEASDFQTDDLVTFTLKPELGPLAQTVRLVLHDRVRRDWKAYCKRYDAYIASL